MNNVKFNYSNVLRVLLTGAFVLSGTACSSNDNVSTSSNTSSSAFSGMNPLTIANSGVIPVIGDNNTSSVIYVHNNSNQTISGIKYVAQVNTGTDKFLDNKSTALCATIPAGQSCSLSFTTPTLSKTTAQGAALITASYDYDNKPYQFSQTLSFKRVDDNTARGVLFSSGVELTSAGNGMAYGTVYAYGSGQNKVYTVDSITSNKGGVQIIQGNITGKQLQSNYVSALEISAPTNLLSSNNNSKLSKTTLATNATDGFSAILTAQSSSGSNSYSSTSNVGVVPVSSGAILTVGNVPIINSSIESTGTFYIINGGNAPATLGSITFPAGVANTGTGSCGLSLAAGAGCSIVFSIPQAGGNGNITVDYTGGSASSVTTTVTWYNSKSEALLQMSANPNPLTFSATLSGATTVTLTNIGGYDLTGVTTSQTTSSGSATSSVTTPLACVDSNNNSTGTKLPIGGSCTYSVTVLDNETDIGKNINLDISGTYNNGSSQSYSRRLALTYTSNQYKALLSVPVTTMPTIVGDNIESSTAIIVVSNNGEAPAVITNSTLSGNPAYLTVTNDGCSGATVNPSGNCSVALKLGPTIAQSQITGNATYSVTYGGGQTPAGTGAGTSDNINYIVQANNQNITMTSVTPSSGITGKGAITESYQISGTLSSPTVTLTYTNSGTNPVQISGISNTNSPISWAIDTTASSCYSSGNLPSATIAPSSSCTIVFNNVLAQYAQAVSGGVGATYTENLTVPTLVFQDIATSTQFQVTPSAPAPISGNTIYAQGNQATLVNSVSSTATTVTVSQSLANAANYPALTVVSTMENYFTGNPIINSSFATCTPSSGLGVMSQTCTFNPDSNGTANAAVTYSESTVYSGQSLHVLFNNTTSNSPVVSFTPLSGVILMP